MRLIDLDNEEHLLDGMWIIRRYTRRRSIDQFVLEHSFIAQKNLKSLESASFMGEGTVAQLILELDITVRTLRAEQLASDRERVRVARRQTWPYPRRRNDWKLTFVQDALEKIADQMEWKAVCIGLKR